MEEDLLAELMEIAKNCEVNLWNGFHKTNSYVLDGDGFGISMTFADGTVLSASGNNSFPKGYMEVHQQVVALFEDAVERYAPPGDVPTSVWAVFERGETSFHLYVYKDSSDLTWFRLDISDPNDEYGLGEEFHFKESVEEFPFEAVGQILRDYDVAAWDGWNQEAEEGAERFELSLSFGMRKELWAEGTKYPESYEQVRDELIRETVEFVKKNGLESQPEEQ